MTSHMLHLEDYSKKWQIWRMDHLSELSISPPAARKTLLKRLRLAGRDLVVLLFALPFVLFYVLYVATIRFKRVEHAGVHERWLKGEPMIFPHYHCDIPLVVGKHPFTTFSTMASQSKDGDFIAMILRLLHYKVARGSSSKGGADARRLLEKFIAEGHHVALAVDGPRGPRGVVKIGTLLLARNTGAPLILSACAADRPWYLRSWDRMMFPKPFSRAVLVCDEPFFISPTASNEELESLRAKVEARLYELSEMARKELG